MKIRTFTQIFKQAEIRSYILDFESRGEMLLKKLTLVTIGLGVLFGTAGCSAVGLNPYTNHVSRLASNTDVSISTCGDGSYENPGKVTINNKNEELIKTDITIGFYDQTGKQVATTFSYETVPSETIAQGTFGPTDVIGWETCKVIDTLILPGS